MTSKTDPYAQARIIYETISLLRRHRSARSVLHVSSGKQRALTLELTMPQMHCLMAARDLGHATIKQLAEHLQVSPPSASTMVDRLVEMGVMLRTQNPENRREVVVRPAEGVLPELDAAERDFLYWLVELLNEMGPEYAEKWADVYAHLGELLLRRSGMEKV